MILASDDEGFSTESSDDDWGTDNRVAPMREERQPTQARLNVSDFSEMCRSVRGAGPIHVRVIPITSLLQLKLQKSSLPPQDAAKWNVYTHQDPDLITGSILRRYEQSHKKHKIQNQGQMHDESKYKRSKIQNRGQTLLQKILDTDFNGKYMDFDGEPIIANSNWIAGLGNHSVNDKRSTISYDFYDYCPRKESTATTSNGKVSTTTTMELY